MNRRLLFPVIGILARAFFQPLEIRAAQANAAEVRAVEGWTVLVRCELLERDTKATERALELLGQQLREIVRAVPSNAVVEHGLCATHAVARRTR